MLKLQLSDEELAQTTRRAGEIATQIAISGSSSAIEEQYAGYLQATEEVGIPREAALQALREQLQIHEMVLEPGSRVFAPSADGYWYAATVKLVAQHRVTVAFDVGGEHTCDIGDLKPFSLTPGKIVHACWKGDEGWYGARIRKYDAEKQKVEVVYRMDGTVETVPLKRVRLFAEKPTTQRGAYQLVPNPLLDLFLKISTGGAIGFLLAWLIK